MVVGPCSAHSSFCRHLGAGLCHYFSDCHTPAMSYALILRGRRGPAYVGVQILQNSIERWERHHAAATCCCCRCCYCIIKSDVVIIASGAGSRLSLASVGQVVGLFPWKMHVLYRSYVSFAGVCHKTPLAAVPFGVLVETVLCSMACGLPFRWHFILWLLLTHSVWFCMCCLLLEGTA